LRSGPPALSVRPSSQCGAIHVFTFVFRLALIKRRRHSGCSKCPRRPRADANSYSHSPCLSRQAACRQALLQKVRAHVFGDASRRTWSMTSPHHRQYGGGMPALAAARRALCLAASRRRCSMLLMDGKRNIENRPRTRRASPTETQLARRLHTPPRPS